MIDLSSDTATRPTNEMRRKIAAAAVGDEQRREDPTVNLLQERVAGVLGKEAALFLPSGVMCNAIAVKTWTRPGDTVLCEADCHIVRAEAGGIGLLSGCVVEPIRSTRGIFTGRQLAAALPALRIYSPPASLVTVENTHNFAGGTCWPVDQLRDVAAVAQQLELKLHMDGARLFNASAATGVTPAAYAACCDSVWVDFSKGLGAPVGAVLAGERGFVESARRYKHMFGGAMRQAGVLAAGCLHALNHHLPLLAEDHANCRRLYHALAEVPGVRFHNAPPETNILFFATDDAGVPTAEFLRQVEARGVRLSGLQGMARAVTHLDVTRQDIETAIQIFGEVLGR